jgi:hypothetical protein
MNEHIRKIADKSGMSLIDSRIWQSVLIRYTNNIVIACAEKLEQDGMVEAAMELKQHFGIEP